MDIIIPRRRRSQIKRRKRSFAQPITQEEALAFLKQVKSRFRDNARVYDQFLRVFIDYKRNRIGIVGLLTRVQQLLDGHFDLLRRLNGFLPKDYQIILPDGYRKIVEFLEKVEMRFADDRQRFLKIIEYIDEYKTVPKDSLQLVTNKIYNSDSLPSVPSHVGFVSYQGIKGQVGHVGHDYKEPSIHEKIEFC